MGIFTEEQQLRKFITERMKLDFDKLTIERIIEISKTNEFLSFKFQIDLSRLIKPEFTIQQANRLGKTKNHSIR